MELSTGFLSGMHSAPNPLQLVPNQDNTVRQSGILNDRSLTVYNSSREVLNRLVDKSLKSQEQAIQRKAVELALKDKEIVILNGRIKALEYLDQEKTIVSQQYVEILKEELETSEESFKEAQKALPALNEAKREIEGLKESNSSLEAERQVLQRRIQKLEKALGKKGEEVRVIQEVSARAHAELHQAKEEIEELRSDAQKSQWIHENAICAAQEQLLKTQEGWNQIKREFEIVAKGWIQTKGEFEIATKRLKKADKELGKLKIDNERLKKALLVYERRIYYYDPALNKIQFINPRGRNDSYVTSMSQYYPTLISETSLRLEYNMKLWKQMGLAI